MLYSICRLFARLPALLLLGGWATALIIYHVLDDLIHLARGLKPASDHLPCNIKSPKSIKRAKNVINYTSFYFQCKDGTQLAVDVWLPKTKSGSSSSPQQSVPVIFHQARYYRSAQISWPLNLFNKNKPINMICNLFFQAFLDRGMAVVSVDVRGTGASQGRLHGPWHQQELEDGLEIIDWVLQQEWSNGSIATWGISYEATAALMTAVTHPAVVACAPNCYFSCMFNDIAFLGGLCLKSFITDWQFFNDSLDNNNMGALSWATWLFFDHVATVPGQEDKLRDALLSRKNWRATDEMYHIQHLNDRSPVSSLSPAEQSPFVRLDTYLQKVRAMDPVERRTKTPAFYFVSGWLDTSAFCTIRLHHHLQALDITSTAVIGPWTHANAQMAGLFPKSVSRISTFDHPTHVANFFEHVLAVKGGANGAGNDDDNEYASHVKYYVMQEEKWKTGREFPVNSTHATSLQFYLSSAAASSSKTSSKSNGGVTLLKEGEAVMTDSNVIITVDWTKDKGPHAGNKSRYNAMIFMFDLMDYSIDWWRCKKEKASHVTFRSSILSKDVEVTGVPQISLWISSSEKDATLFVYLGCEDEKGDGYYVTEGMFRAIHRNVIPSDQAASSVLHFPGTPHHSYLKNDAKELEPHVPALVNFSLMPTSFCFKAGQRILISVAGADKDHFLPPRSLSTFALTIYTGPSYPSKLILPSPSSSST